jgi:uncharacterized protein
VLDSLRTGAGAEGLFYWRDKSGREVDFVWRRGRDTYAVECKINPDRFNPESLRVFHDLYPLGRNYLFCPGIQDSYERRVDGLILRITGCRDLRRDLEKGVGKES